MRALNYHGSHDVRVEDVPDPTLLATGDILGHEFMGVVEECGSGITQVRRGDRVVIAFVFAAAHNSPLSTYSALENPDLHKFRQECNTTLAALRVTSITCV